jgi:GT2 family glycosyltransferase
MDVSIIIVAYNSEQTITDCINSVIDTVKKHSYEILISDNSRNDNTKDLVKKQYKENVIYFQNEDNLGFSKGNNRAVVKSKGKYVLFLNPDTKVYKGTIDGMLDFMKAMKQRRKT